VDGDTVKLSLGSKSHDAGKISATPAKGYLRFGGREYRGRLDFYPSRDGSSLIVLNVLPLEEYLLGVVPSEMPSAWPAEALKAQAVAARTYALCEMLEKRNSERDGKPPSYDVYDGQSDQVYRGVDAEDPRSTAAVKATAGIVLTYKGKPILAQFCADAGGATKCGSQPYLQSVPSFAPESPHNEWVVRLSPGELAALAASEGVKLGSVSAVLAENDPHSGHLLSLKCIGAGGRSCEISGTELRSQLGLSTMKSTLAYVAAPGTAEPKPDKPSAKQAAGGPAKGKPAPRQPKQAMEATDVCIDPDSLEAAGAYGLAAGQQSDGGDLAGAAQAAVSADGEASVAQGADSGGPLSSGTTDESSLQRNPTTSKAATKADPAKLEQAGRLLDPPLDIPASTKLSVGPAGIELRGSGYGHGIGLSQWGARELADAGLDYLSILLHFYQDVEVFVMPQAAAGKASRKAAEVCTEDDSPGDAVDVFYQPFDPAQ
jgi:stage II sporulation protein D